MSQPLDIEHIEAAQLAVLKAAKAWVDEAVMDLDVWGEQSAKSALREAQHIAAVNELIDLLLGNQTKEKKVKEKNR